MYPKSLIDTVLRRTDIVRVAERYTELRKSGAGMVGRCPFHEEETGSFYVSPSRQTWHCFGACQDGGDAIKLLQKAEGWDFRTAFLKLAVDAGVEVEEEAEDPKDKERRLHAESLRGLNGRVAEFYRSLLHADT